MAHHPLIKSPQLFMQNHYISPSNRTISLLIKLIFLSYLHAVRGNLQTAYEQVVGSWNINLRMMQSPNFYETLVFSPSYDPFSSNNATRNIHTLDLPIKRDPVLPCLLSIHPNGTFSLFPRKDQSLSMNPIYGYWSVQPNPYCVTDRQYDELYMVSLPRVQMKKVPISRFSKSPLIVQAHAILEFRCRVWGRFSSRTIQKIGFRFFSGRNTARMTHGTCSLLMERCRNPHTKTMDSRDDENRKENVPTSQYYMVGSFQGRADSDSVLLQNIRTNDDDYYNYYNIDE